MHCVGLHYMILPQSTKQLKKILGFKLSPCSEYCILFGGGVIPRRRNFICRRFGTLPIYVGGPPPMKTEVFRNVGI